jgi:hypothetical protein
MGEALKVEQIDLMILCPREITDAELPVLSLSLREQVLVELILLHHAITMTDVGELVGTTDPHATSTSSRR